MGWGVVDGKREGVVVRQCGCPCSLDWKARRELGSEWELIYQVWGNSYLLKNEVECNS